MIKYMRCMCKKALLQSLRHNARRGLEELAEELGLSLEEVSAEIQDLENRGVILGYQAIIDQSKGEACGVSAFIEVKCTPERGGGFDRLAQRIAKFDQVESCYLASGGYDLFLVVGGDDLMHVVS